MTSLVWDELEKRTYEAGVDKGVLYLPNGSAVPWNGLVSVIEKFDRETNTVYFDGMKINDFVTFGDFKATLKAITYPDEFFELEGYGEHNSGVFLGNQKSKLFGLCYRTQVGNGAKGESVGYKIHILYNLTAVPSDKTFETITDEVSVNEFEWELSAIPEEVPGFAPTAHLIINSLNVDPWMLEDLERLLYGNDEGNAILLPMSELIDFFTSWFRLHIVDNGDGTWTASTEREGVIHLITEELFELLNINAVYLDSNTYVISDTKSLVTDPVISIIDNGNGTWTASSDYDFLISVDPEGLIEITNANAVFIADDTYRISDTLE